MVLHPDGDVIKDDLVDASTGRPYRFLPENEAFRDEITALAFAHDGTFQLRQVVPRPIPLREEPFEVAWAAFRSKTVFKNTAHS
jgi:hypothetical protein